MKVYCLINDANGRAVVGTAEVSDALLASARQLDAVDKAPNEPREPHHPGKPTMIRVARGAHTIISISRTAPSEETFLRLQPGDRVLFLDFPPAAKPPARGINGEGLHHYTGHRSVVGPEGAVLERWEWDETIDMAAINWQAC